MALNDGHGEYASSTNCKYIEVLQYPNQPDPIHHHGFLNDDTLPGWLSKNYSTAREHEAPTCGIRVLILYRTWVEGRCRDDYHADFCFTADVAILVQIHWGLPESFYSWSSRTKASAYRYSKICNNSIIMHGLVFYHRLRFDKTCQYAIFYDDMNAMTHALVLADDRIDLDSRITSCLSSARKCDLHPLWICSIISRHLIERSRIKVEKLSMHASELAGITGQHLNSSILYTEILKIDFLAATRSLNHTSQKMANEARMIKSIINQLTKVKTLNQDIILPLNTPNKKVISAIFEDSIEYDIESCRDLLNTSEYIGVRVATLIQVVYQFMTQKDAKINIALVESSAAIAKAAKADSSAMKTIAVLGMFFLPGAFVAAVFAMPVFDWDSNGKPFVKPAFKYYWAITAPLTLSVFLSWGLAMILPWHRWIFKLSGKKAVQADVELPLR
ncbi:hypothetical protein BKA64DRAFT_655996 [Cadophora sp. MPI-SDFR-AT-0126]|nr:hypothetical protein BKA64DRAFT_655996 [Leotiomycetes sp. MPI-SDFR-AT-0126]